MWFFGLYLVTVFLYGSQAEEHHCTQFPQYCVEREGFPLSFPETEEDLIRSCSAGIGALECIIDHAENCDLERIQEMKGYTLRMIKLVCNRGNPVFDVIVQNLKCIKTAVEQSVGYDDDICSKMIIKAREQISKDDFDKIEDLFSKINATEEEHELRMCYNIAFETACAVATLSHTCGAETKENIQIALEESNFLEEICKPNNFAIVSKYAKYLDV